MSRQISHRGVDKYVELVNDKRYNATLFATGIAHEHPDVQRAFFDTILSYLSILANQYAAGSDYFQVSDIAAMSYKMYKQYIVEGGTGTVTAPDLSPLDIPF